jgi:RNA polymerase sigma-70 factor (ECF subfamily)
MSASQVETIWSEFGANLRRFIQKRVSDPQAADDILQNVFVKIHTRLDSLHDDRKLTSWVYQITRNAIIDYYRQTPKRVPLDDELPALSSDDDEIQANLTASLRSMVDCLPDEYRVPLMLDAFEGLSQAEIAARLGISLSGAKSRVQRARAKLRDLMFECCHFEFDRRGSVIDYHPRANCCPRCGTGPNVLFLSSQP